MVCFILAYNLDSPPLELLRSNLEGRGSTGNVEVSYLLLTYSCIWFYYSFGFFFLFLFFFHH